MPLFRFRPSGAAVRARPRFAAAALAAALAAAGCSTPSTADRYYRLGADAAALPAPAPAGSGRVLPVVAVGAVSVPELVDRAQIVTQGPGQQVFLRETHRWAEPLKNAIGRLVAERVSAALGGALVAAYPAAPALDVGHRVSVAVQRFDSFPGVAAETALLWTVRRVADGAQLSGRTALRTVPADPSIDAVVAAHAQALRAAADEIAAAVSTLAARPLQRTPAAGAAG